jgi:hypothetical protein
VNPNLELFTRLFIHVYGPVHGIFVNIRRNGNRAGKSGSGVFGRIDDLGHGLVQDSVVKGLEFILMRSLFMVMCPIR